jgi:hypothetical protein
MIDLREEITEDAKSESIEGCHECFFRSWRVYPWFHKAYPWFPKKIECVCSALKEQLIIKTIECNELIHEEPEVEIPDWCPLPLITEGPT